MNVDIDQCPFNPAPAYAGQVVDIAPGKKRHSNLMEIEYAEN